MPDQTMRERVTDQTPSTEDVQSAATQCPDGITPAEWDAWLTTYISIAAAAALKAMADEVRHYDSRATPRGIAAAITTRANRIEADRG